MIQAIRRPVAGQQVDETLPKVAALFSKWKRFLVGGPSAKVLANFIKHGTEAGGTSEAAEAAHWIVALFDPAMILLDPTG